MAMRVVRDRGQGVGQLRFRRCEDRLGIRNKGIRAGEDVRVRRSNECIDIVGVSGERAIEKAAPVRDCQGPSYPY